MIDDEVLLSEEWKRLEPARALAAWLVEYRSVRGMTQAQIAHGLGWPVELVEEVETAEGLTAPSPVREDGEAFTTDEIAYMAFQLGCTLGPVTDDPIERMNLLRSVHHKLALLYSSMAKEGS